VTPDRRLYRRARRVARRAQLVKQRTREKNQVHAILIRNLRPRPPMSDLFVVAGRVWLAEQELPTDEREMLDACLREVDFLDEAVARVDRALAELPLSSLAMRRLMTLPGQLRDGGCLDGRDRRRQPPSDRGAVGQLSRLRPAVCQSGSEPARHGRIYEAGPGDPRHLLVEAAWRAARTTGPPRVFRRADRQSPRLESRVVAVARKLAVIWHMLSRDEDYAFARPSLVREKLRRAELMSAPSAATGNRGPR
jgi:transposase